MTDFESFKKKSMFNHENSEQLWSITMQGNVTLDQLRNGLNNIPNWESPEGMEETGVICYYDEFDGNLEVHGHYKESEATFHERALKEWEEEEPRLKAIAEAREEKHNEMMGQIEETDLATLRNLANKYGWQIERKR